MSPHKPTREDASGASDPREMYDGRVPPTGGREAGVDEDSGREEKGSAAASRKHPPHETPNDREAEARGAKDEQEGPVLPANAQGEDRVDSDEHAQPIDQESMYDGRPEEDKHQPPSDRVFG